MSLVYFLLFIFGVYDKLKLDQSNYLLEVTPLDKYEYNLKLDQMKTLVSEGKFESAAEIADTINWNKIKNVNALVKAGEVYEMVERYEDAREILLSAYDRSPIGRTIIYR